MKILILLLFLSIILTSCGSGGSHGVLIDRENITNVNSLEFISKNDKAS